MTIIQSFLEQNEPIVTFGYGLVFFIMGLAIALQSRQSSRLELARSLAWLAAFGMLHSLYEWGELFSPVHEVYLSPAGIKVLHDLHLMLLSISYACLMAFGVSLLRPLRKGQWLRYAAAVIVIGYGLGVVLVLPAVLPDPHVWHHTSEALAGYLLGLPGGILAAYGLREQTYRYIKPLNAPHIVTTLRITGIALVAYALLAGLFPPRIPFFPGNILNKAAFEQFLGVPPLVFHAVIGLVLAVTVIRALEVFQVETERRIEQMEQQQIMASERERLARELHDRTIQTAYTAGLMVDSARMLADPESPIHTRLDRAVTALDAVIHDLRQGLGELHPSLPAEPLAVLLERIADDPRYRSLIDIRLNLDLPGDDSLSPGRSHHVLAIMGEALANIVRHARASEVMIQAKQVEDRLHLLIFDNGIGFSERLESGFGIRNMQERANILGGKLTIQSDRDKGTLVSLDIPWEG
jgi:signal transduction histidine kinase